MTAKHADAARLIELSGQVIGCAFTVQNRLGCGLLARAYDNALALELREAGLVVTQQFGIQAFWKGAAIGDYVAGLLSEDAPLIALTMVKARDTAIRCTSPTTWRRQVRGFACC